MKSKAYAYIRVPNSGSGNIEYQKRAIKEYCEKKHITDIAYFNVSRNKVVRGTDDYNAMLEKMKEDEEGCERIFVAADLSKVTRSLDEWIKIEDDMKELGIECHMAATGPISLLMDKFHVLQYNS